MGASIGRSIEPSGRKIGDACDANGASIAERGPCMADAMSDPARALTVAVFNASDDTVEMLKVLLADRGYVALSGEVDKVKSGVLDFIAFIDAHRPDAM